MEKPSKVLLVALFIIYTCALGLAVAAERRRSTGRQVPDKYDDTTYCVYDSDVASGYGVGALLFLLTSQALVMGVTRLTFIIAEACLVGGAVRNAYHTKYRGVFGVD
ncbi:hypothetical protein KI387_026881, partial [Taxus chinensis]